MTEDEIKIAVGEDIVALLSEAVFTVDGTPMATHKTKEGAYKNKPLVPGAEFMVSGSYVGKRKKLIFVFSPVDAQEFSVEVDYDKMDQTFGTFGVELGEAAGIDKEKTVPIIKYLIAKKADRAAEEAEITAKQEAARRESHYAGNPNFGRF